MNPSSEKLHNISCASSLIVIGLCILLCISPLRFLQIYYALSLRDFAKVDLGNIDWSFINLVHVSLVIAMMGAGFGMLVRSWVKFPNCRSLIVKIAGAIVFSCLAYFAFLISQFRVF